jgi:hypothetical protein
MEEYDLLAELWRGWCESRGVECRDACEMALDPAMPRDVQFMASRFAAFWERVE